MSYYISKQISASYEDAVARVKEQLKKEGFGILTEIDVKQTLKKKLDVDFRILYPWSLQSALCIQGPASGKKYRFIASM